MLNGLAQNHDLFKVICFKIFSMKMMKNHIVVHYSWNMKMRYTTFCIIHWHVCLKSYWLKKRKAASRSHLQNAYLLWGTNFMIFFKWIFSSTVQKCRIQFTCKSSLYYVLQYKRRGNNLFQKNANGFTS